MIRKLKSGEYRLYSRKINPKTGKRRKHRDVQNPRRSGEARACRAVLQAWVALSDWVESLYQGRRSGVDGGAGEGSGSGGNGSLGGGTGSGSGPGHGCSGPVEPVTFARAEISIIGLKPQVTLDAGHHKKNNAMTNLVVDTRDALDGDELLALARSLSVATVPVRVITPPSTERRCCASSEMNPFESAARSENRALCRMRRRCPPAGPLRQPTLQ
jgi:hypothetical protein